MTPNQATIKAALVTALFAVFGFFSYHPQAFASYGLETQSMIGLYALLLVHTFFSVRCFSQLIDPRDRYQIIIDLLLVVSYFAVSFWTDPALFLITWMCLFSLATLKYVLLIGRFNHVKLLRRKLIADVGGLGLGVLALYTGNLPLMFVLFALASGYYLLVRPLYVPDKKV